MPIGWSTFPIEFRGGLISNLSPLQQGINAVGSATVLQNFEPARSGGYSKISGYTKAEAEIIPGVGPVLGVKVIGPEEYVVARNNGTATEYYLTTGEGWSSLGSAALIGGKIRSTDFNFGGGQKTLFVDGTNFPAIYDDTTNSLTFTTGQADLEGVEQVAIFKTTTFVSKGPLLYFSAPGKPDDFTSANGGGVISIGYEVTGLVTFRDQLIIFSRNKIQRLVGSSVADFQILPITETIGCISPDTIQEVGGDIMYMSPDGLRTLAATDKIGDFALNIASDPIADDAYDFIQSSTEFCSLVIREKAQYRVFSYTGSQLPRNSRGLLATRFSARGETGIAWAQTVGIKAYVVDSKYVGNFDEVVLFAHDDGYLYRMESGNTFDGEAISAVFESPYMPISDPQIRKTFFKATCYVEPTGSLEITLETKYDFGLSQDGAILQPEPISIGKTGAEISFYGSTAAIFGVSSYGGELERIFETPIIGSGKNIAIRVEDKSTNPTFTLDTLVLEYSVNDRQ